jgi:O-antigen/teichoic acid export membrane protein
MKSFLFAGGSSALGVLLRTGLGILLIPFLLHHLGIEQYGLYMFCLGCIELVALFDFGFSLVLTRQLAQSSVNDNIFNETLSHAHVFYTLVSACLLGLLSLFQILYFKKINVFALVMLELVGTFYFNYYRAFLLSQNKHYWTNIGDSLQTLFIFIVGGVLVAQGHGLWGLILARCWAFVLKSALQLFIAYRLTKHVVGFHLVLGLSNIPKLLKDSLQAYLIQLSILISHKVDGLVLGLCLGMTSVGHYDILNKLSNLPQTLNSKINEASLPFWSGLILQNEQAKLKQVYYFLSNSYLAIVTVFFIWLNTHLQHITKLISANQLSYTVIEQGVLIMGMTFALSALQMPAGHWLFAQKEDAFLSKSSMASAGMNLVLSIILVKLYGLNGVIGATLIVVLVQYGVWIIPTACKSLKITSLEYLQFIIAPSTFFGMILWETSGLFRQSGFFYLIAHAIVMALLFIVFWVLLFCPAFIRQAGIQKIRMTLDGRIKP